ncbi:hypothetical protein GCM10007916_17710 [Psychromonas marina]|uniref:N-acetyltransferase domain-containing protein n=1 Tax=Psychromonas marina TaxID=88364 RepID=A0ABQ6DZV0_9GAMM|nr:GNAT family N-acetyltransferase [Psychromonas marina]GLS90704.1 hypothetical protein GCM10007916_17710 [Psychromonas marina]
MLDSNYHFIELEKLKYPLVNQFYKRVYKKGIAGKNEAVFILRNKQEIICSAKLKSIEGCLLLTGVACDERYQHQGHASRLVKQVLEKQQQAIFCFPYPHLQDFYLRLGFSLLAVEDAPQNIGQRFLRYLQHRELLLMVRK